MNPGLEKDLIGVDIADSGEDPLIEEERLDTTAPSVEKLEEGSPVKLQGLRAKAAELGRPLRRSSLEEPEKPKFSHVPEAELSLGLFKINNEMGVFVAGITFPTEQQLTRHLEMEKETQASARIEADELAPAAQADDPLAFQPTEDSLVPVPKKLRPPQLCPRDRQSDETRLETADDCFNLGKLRHWTILFQGGDVSQSEP